MAATPCTVSHPARNTLFTSTPSWQAVSPRRPCGSSPAPSASGTATSKLAPLMPATTPITAAPAKTTKADITFALTPGAPKLYQLGYGAFVTGLSGEGTIAVGDFNRGGPIFRWTAKNGVVP